MKRNLLLLLVALLPIVATAYDAQIGGIYYNFSGNEASVTYRDRNPNSYYGAVVIPASVKYYGKYYSVTSIGDDAFYNCNVTSITIPNSVTSIGEGAFSICESLTSITIPNSVTSIGIFAFSGCRGLTSFTIPNSVTSIGRCAFGDCSSLTSITIPNSVTSIGEATFQACSSLKFIKVEAGNAIYDSRNDCNAIIETATNTLIASCQNTTIPESVTSIGQAAFNYCSGLTSISIPESVTEIGNSAFNGCVDLTSVTIPNSVTSIGSIAFSGCKGLTSVTIGNSVTSIGGGAFNRCSGLTSITIPESVTSIGIGVFKECRSLASIKVEAGNATYDSRNDCNAIIETATNTLITGCMNTIIPNNVTSIGDEAFQGCTGLTFLTIPNSVTSIGDSAFLGCSGLTSITIPNSVTSIIRGTFYGCSGLTSVTIPKSVKSIGSSTFLNCSSLTNVYCYAENVPETYGGAFSGSPIASATLYVPESAIEQYKKTEPWSNFGTIQILQSPTYTLTYIVDGEVYKIYELDDNTPITPEEEPTKEGYTFSGWSEIPETMPDHDVVITGTFTINSYALVYFVDGEEYSKSEVEYGTEITPLEAPTKEGYSFSGWSYIPETMPAGDVVVMGSFSINSYTLTYMVDGEVYKTSTVVYGSEITPEAEPTKEGYTFSGWSDIPEMMPAGDFVVTGTFTVNSYTLSYIVDGEEYKTSSVEYGTTLTPEEEPTREGYTFSGWSEIPETMPAEDVVITGSFIINQYLLTYILDGEEYKSYKVDYNTTIAPEPAPVKKGMTFSGWGEVPETMPACDLTLTGTYSWSKEIVDGIIYQVADTLNNFASVIGTESIIEEATILPYIEIGGDVYEVCSIAEDALPKTVTIYVPIGKLLFWLWTNGYEDIRETDSGRNLTAPEVSLVAVTASSLTLFYANEYPELTETVMVSGSPVEKKENGYEVVLRGLEPDNLYEELATLTLTYEDASYTKSFSFRTNSLTLTTEQPKVVSLGNVVVAAKSNLDDTELNVGFEWRRIDWTDDFASNYGTAYLFEGMMEGYIRNLNADKLWKYRPYYTSNAGNSYYGDWVGIDPTNTSYFEPTVHTYSTINLTGNLAEIWGYVMRGTDNITSQGFIYWNISFSSSRRNANGIPSDAKTVLSSGNVMSVTLENLEYDTEYCYMAFVTTTEGETFYGEPQTFRTDPVDPDAISTTPAVPEVEEQVYDLNGRKLNKPQKGINIIRYSDGTTRKVMIK